MLAPRPNGYQPRALRYAIAKISLISDLGANAAFSPEATSVPAELANSGSSYSIHG
jgi:hypothetical protein